MQERKILQGRINNHLTNTDLKFHFNLIASSISLGLPNQVSFHRLV